MSDHDIDRTLADWFRADALAAEPADGVQRALEAALRSRPRPTWLARPGGHWGWDAPQRATSAGVRVLIAFAVVTTLLGGALLVGAGLVESPALPTSRLGQLAYATGGDIFIADWDGRNPVRIADGYAGGKSGCGSAGYWAEGTMWSPDGRYLAYRSPRSQVDCDRPEADTIPTVILADPAGHVVAEFPGVGWLIPWSPDSTRVATWLDLYPSTMIGVYGVDGVRQALLSLTPSLYGTMSGDYDPVWSPDGASIWILVAATVDTKAIWEVPVDGSPPRLVASGDALSRWGSVPSPDRTQIADDSSGQLVVTAADGSQPRVLAPGIDIDWLSDPTWSPTGERIAFVSNEGRDLNVVDVASGHVTQLVHEEGLESLRAIEFSPEGDRILFSRSDPGGTRASLWSVDPIGAQAQEVVGSVRWFTGDWQPVPATTP